MATLGTEIVDHFQLDYGDDPYWSESSWFSWAIPERNINGFFYNHFRPNMNCLLCGPAMWDLSGRHTWQFRFFDWQLMRQLPEGRYGVDYDKYDFTTPYSFSIRMEEPLRRYRLGYDREGFQLDLVFTGSCDPHSIAPREDHGFTGAYKMHFEQPGRIEGTVELDGERFEVDCFSIRDGSHGRRFLENVTPGGYTWSTADANNGWHVMALNEDRSHDSFVMGGYLFRDGTIASIRQGTRRVLERDGARPIRIEVTATDDLGRELHAIGRERVPAEFQLFPDRAQWWTQYAWDYDGFTGALGEDQEFYGLHDFRRWQRAGPEAWARR